MDRVDYKEERKLYSKKYHIEHKDENKLRSKKWHLAHKEEQNLKSKQYNSKNKEEIKQHRLNPINKNRCNKLRRERRKKDPIYRMICNMRSRNRYALKSQGVKKTLHTIESLGCTKEFFKDYIQSHLKPGMTLENNGKRKWVQHHPIECWKCNLKNIEEQKKCFHYTNIIPMWEDEHKALHAKNPYHKK